MNKIELYSLTPEELGDLIRSSVRSEIQEVLKESNQNVKPNKEFLSRKETAAFFNVSLVCLHDWVKKGILTPFKMGNRTYFRYSDIIQTLLNSNRHEG